MQTKNDQKLKKYALYLLSKREYSKFELIQKLKKFSEYNIIKHIIDDFSEKNLQSDTRFCESFINYKKNKYGNLKLIYELNKKGISKNIYNRFLPSDKEQIITAANILQNKYKNFIDTLPQKQKYINLLSLRGFDYEISIQAIKYWKKDC